MLLNLSQLTKDQNCSVFYLNSCVFQDLSSLKPTSGGREQEGVYYLSHSSEVIASSLKSKESFYVASSAWPPFLQASLFSSFFDIHSLVIKATLSIRTIMQLSRQLTQAHAQASCAQAICPCCSSRNLPAAAAGSCCSCSTALASNPIKQKKSNPIEDSKLYLDT